MNYIRLIILIYNIMIFIKNHRDYYSGLYRIYDIFPDT